MHSNTLLILLLTAASIACADDPDRADSSGSSGELDRVAAVVDFMRGNHATDPAQSRLWAREALEILRRVPDAEMEADVLYYLAASYYVHDRRDSALTIAEQARDAASCGAAALGEDGCTARLTERRGHTQRLLGQLHHDLGGYSESEAAHRAAERIYEELGNARMVAMTANDLAILYKTQGRFPEALAYHERALAAFESLNLEKETITALNGMAIVHTHTGRYGDALESFSRVLAFNEQQEEPLDVAGTLTNIGGVHEYMQEYESALEYFERARLIYESIGAKRRLATALTNVASAQYHLGRFNESSASYERARALARETLHDRLLAYIHEGLGRVYEKQNDPTSALEAFEAALAGFETLGERRGMAATLISLGRLHGGERGISLAMRAVETARQMNSHELLREGHALLAELYEGQGRYADALDAHKRFKAAYDSLFNAENKNAIAALETEFRSREQQQQIALLEQKRQVQRMWMFGLLGGVGLLGAITGLSFNRVRLRQRALAALEKAHRAEAERASLLRESAEAKAHSLTQELDAARRLQLSMLPKEVPTHPEFEIGTFMRTAAEVGGDYYDFHVAGDGTLTIAIGDATGHGTRAGIMVAAAKSLFSNYAEESDLAEVLRRSARAIRRMALPSLYMAFAVVRLRGRELELAGAGMPAALIYRAASRMVEPISLKGMPLGAPADAEYRKACVRLESGDTLVLMSDGFPEMRDVAGAQLGYDSAATVVQEVGHLSPDLITRRFEQFIQDWTKGRALDDDVTCVIVKVK